MFHKIKTYELKKNLKKSFSKNSFYKNYFLDISITNEIPLTEFRDPSKYKKRKYKTFGTKFLKLILKSDSFKKDLHNFLPKVSALH